MSNFKFGNMDVSVNLNANVAYTAKQEAAVTFHTFTVTWNAQDIVTVDRPLFSVSWREDMDDMQYVWHPLCGYDRALKADWSSKVSSCLATNAPVHCIFNEAQENRLTFALDDAMTHIARQVGVTEEGTLLYIAFDIPLDGTGKSESYTVTLREDRTNCRYEDAIRAVSKWWEEKYPPMNVPAQAKDALYSFWYSFHQLVYADKVEEECARAKALGLNAIIVDDGWQTDDNSRGYGFCGDWEVATAKIPDMAAHVKKVHELGLKYILWYSVPWAGTQSNAIRKFAGKTLYKVENLNCYALDPRYPEVRQYLIDTYVSALKDWDLDGFKLDFIDSFRMREETPKYADGMDYVVLEDAVHRLMIDVRDALSAIKPDVFIEFRQSYIGPVMREFGNMFRVADCPAAPNTNRVGVADLRLLSGDTAVHSDMLEWNAHDRIESAVGQILNCIFGTVQVSADLAKVPEDHCRAIRYWVDFMKAEKELLQNAPLYAEMPQLLYPQLRTQKDGRCAVAVYDPDRLAKLSAAHDEILLFNATRAPKLSVLFNGEAQWKVEVRECHGDVVSEQTLNLNGYTELAIPESGMARLVKQ